MKHSSDIDCILVDIDRMLLNGATDTPAATPVHSATRVPSAVIVLLAAPAVLAEVTADLLATTDAILAELGRAPTGSTLATLEYFSWKTPGRKKHARRCHAENPGRRRAAQSATC